MATLKDRLFLPLQGGGVSILAALTGYLHWDWFLYNPVDAALGIAVLLFTTGLFWFYAQSREEDPLKRARLRHWLALAGLVLGMAWLLYLVLMPLRFPNAFEPRTTVRLVGSTTLGEYLIPQYLQALLARNNPVRVTTSVTAIGATGGESIQIDADFTGVPLDSRPDPVFKELDAVRFIVDAVGSGKGREAWETGYADIAMISGSHDLQGLNGQVNPPRVAKIGRDAVTIIVNRNNPVNSLPYNDLQKIFSGQAMSQWQVFTREKSGTTQDLSDYLQLPGGIQGSKVASNVEMINAVARNAQAIGYASVSFLSRNPNVKALGIERAGQSYPAPSRDSIRQGLTDPETVRSIYLYGSRTVGADVALNTRIANFLLDSIESSEWQDFVTATGFLATSDNCPTAGACGRVIERDFKGNVPTYQEYQAKPPAHSIAFASGGDAPDNDQINALDAWVQHLSAAERSQPVVVFGHSDSAGNPLYNRGLSIARAEWVQRLLEDKYQLKVQYIAGLGSEYPQPQGESRRVEVFHNRN
ncbi:ABC-type phosphate transport system, substrate-binding protein [Thiothrix caldifontis]|uniref:ABC-type phosphate transport system, substrate-binding protein n=1 Tax=Thiothrix caldifontis TaxID=525918 RepID=A0A1H4FYQ3_9GAMM|nr:substrate-binding domain-containing protein [Thiothrix caldifontis]SEB02241.1 ABC-type phosphate transport system, substrate-binding protein [Thiothrix caldifontis]